MVAGSSAISLHPWEYLLWQVSLLGHGAVIRGEHLTFPIGSTLYVALWPAVLSWALYYLEGTSVTGSCSPKPSGAGPLSSACGPLWAGHLPLSTWIVYWSSDFPTLQTWHFYRGLPGSSSLSCSGIRPKLAVTDTSGAESQPCGPTGGFQPSCRVKSLCPDSVFLKPLWPASRFSAWVSFSEFTEPV